MHTHTYLIREIDLVFKPLMAAQITTQPLTAHQTAQLLYKYWDQNRIAIAEEFKVLYLDNASNIIGMSTIGQGGLNRVTVDAKLIFATALKALATRIILAHNHPSGNTKPSSQDHAVTQNIAKICRMLDIDLCDHIILSPTQGHYTSMHDEGYLPAGIA
ncbi:MAG TPA: DNA repair protein [Cytophagales bacterium]|nr:DNA repair protein [Cytophagales bacterium]HAA23375.1 DNA repair protein [Cytophagales bacterium]